MKDFDLPETHYALSGEVNIAYQSMGNGPIDFVYVPGFMSHIEFMHELPGYTAFLRRLSKFARVITFDKRGQGLSDRVSDAPSLEQRMDDVRAVMDAVGSNRAVLFGISEGSAMSVLFAATYPDRVSRLLLFGGYANRRDMSADLDDRLQQRVKLWGTGALMRIIAPSAGKSPEAIAQFAKFERLSASPGAVKSFMRLNSQIDITSIFPAVRVPTLVLHRTNDMQIPIKLGRELASLMPEAKFIEYPGQYHAVATGDVEAMLGDIEEFVTGHRNTVPDETERILATVLFSDIVDFHRSVAEKAMRRGGRCSIVTTSSRSNL